jgi:hypothetical protein
LFNPFHSNSILYGTVELDTTPTSSKRLNKQSSVSGITLRRAIAEVKQGWSVIGWVTKNLLSCAPPCLGRHVKPLISAAFAVVRTYQPALDPSGGLWPVVLCVIHKEGLCPSSGDINRLMILMVSGGDAERHGLYAEVPGDDAHALRVRPREFYGRARLRLVHPRRAGHRTRHRSVYIHPYIHLHTYIFIHTSSYKHLHTNIFMQTFSYIHLLTYIYIHTSSYKHLDTYIFIHAMCKTVNIEYFSTKQFLVF